jgi:hypothetical protein
VLTAEKAKYSFEQPPTTEAPKMRRTMNIETHVQKLKCMLAYLGQKMRPIDLSKAF